MVYFCFRYLLRVKADGCFLLLVDDRSPLWRSFHKLRWFPWAHLKSDFENFAPEVADRHRNLIALYLIVNFIVNREKSRYNV